MLRKLFSNLVMVVALTVASFSALPTVSAQAGNYYNKPTYFKKHIKPRYYKAPRRTYTRQRPAPWTAAWYDYCHARYRSFNARTGYFRGYDGRRHFCR